MTSDHTPHILLACLLILGIMGCMGINNQYQEGLDARMAFAENRWEHAVHLRNKRINESCVRRSNGWANELGTYFDPETTWIVYRTCIEGYEPYETD